MMKLCEGIDETMYLLLCVHYSITMETTDYSVTIMPISGKAIGRVKEE